jgi:hypothetical protein
MVTSFLAEDSARGLDLALDGTIGEGNASHLPEPADVFTVGVAVVTAYDFLKSDR